MSATAGAHGLYDGSSASWLIIDEEILALQIHLNILSLQKRMQVIKSCMSVLLPLRYSECWGSAGTRPLARTGHNRRLPWGWGDICKIIAHQCAGAIRHVSILKCFYNMGCHVLVRSCILGSLYRGFSGWHLFHGMLVLPLYVYSRCRATTKILLCQGWLPSLCIVACFRPSENIDYIHNPQFSTMTF